MGSMIADFIGRNPSLEVPTVYRNAKDFIEICAFEQRVEILTKLAKFLVSGDFSKKSDDWEKSTEAILTHIETTLAQTPGEEQVKGAFNVVCMREQCSFPLQMSSSRRMRTLASVLASEQDVAALRALFHESMEETNALEFCSLVLHELVLRGVQCSETPELSAHLDLLSKLGHPLSRLPGQLRSLELEIEDYLPRYSLSSTSWSQPSQDIEMVASNVGGAVVGFKEKPLSAERKERIAAAVSHWDSSRGVKTEIRCFEFEDRFDMTDFGTGILTHLGFESYRNDLEEPLMIQRLDPEEAFGLLFASASQQGSTGTFMGAYGRLMAWRSMEGFCFEVGDQSLKNIETAVRANKWCDVFSPSLMDRTQRHIGFFAYLASSNELIALIAYDGHAGLDF